MNEKLKIAYMGAGSAAWAIEIIRDLIVSESLNNSEVVLHDINEEKLKASFNLAKRYNSLTGGKLDLKMSLDPVNTITDSDFVINTVLAGGHELQESVREISEKFGYYRGVESREFNMVSDYSTSFANFDQMEYTMRLQENISDHSPEALLINVSNPMFELQTALYRKSKIKSVSYCEGPLHFRDVAEFFHIDGEGMEYQMAGINHNLFLTRMVNDSEDVYQKIEEWLKTSSEKYWTTDPYYTQFNKNMDIWTLYKKDQFSRAAFDMYKLYGLLPIADGVRSGTWKYHYNLETKKKWYGLYGGFDSEIGWSLWLKYLKENENVMKDFLTDDQLLLKKIPNKMGPDPIIPLIEALTTGKKTRLHLNVRNDGNIPQLPSDCAVEVPVVADKHGIHPEKVHGLNERVVKDVLIPRATNMELALDAHFSGSKDLLLEILFRDVRTKSEKQANEVLEHVLNAPGNNNAKKHYK
jgi:alpha-galactosidase